ncbi:peptidoglycan DD-metalloendopeptidase family protein [Rhizobium sp. 0TCS1.26]|uniref:peptidoglycan DD-metalloendopeptidase family protein n=1 Tax=Rhizobium sp. 0TCS1.26 TaxID=3142623 RepID=UPI003D2CEB98
MRVKKTSNVRKSAVRIAVAALLASAATGCSSDATRFAGVFDRDNLTTASIPQRQGGAAYGQAPMPTEDVGNGGQPSYGAGRSPVAQSYPSANSGSYPSASASPARSAAAPVAVQRSTLSAPGSSSLPPVSEPQNRQQAMAQPLPPRTAETAPVRRPPAVDGDNVTTGSTRPAGWSAANAPKVTLRPGETAATLSRRYGVPEKEILRANGGALTAGQIVVIPTFGGGNAAKMAAGSIDLSKDSNPPMPARENGDKVAVLPSATARDKAQAEGAKLTPPTGGSAVPPSAGSYTVKAGDTLSKIAQATRTPIDRLKADNGLNDGNLRIGQTLKVSGEAGDQMKTASIVRPAVEKPAAPMKAEPVVAKPDAPAQAAEAPSAQSASLTDVEKKSDVSAAAPTATGISKYRWPVTGAVTASYGQNVDGNRNDGINISVPEGTPIKSAENGVVIYAGNGLKQLGNTVLVRHDDGKVTVYGHASNISVSRGQKVQRGQTIATSGMSGDAKRPQVHFEVRKDATPVNPITFLE